MLAQVQMLKKSIGTTTIKNIECNPHSKTQVLLGREFLMLIINTVSLFNEF